VVNRRREAAAVAFVQVKTPLVLIERSLAS